jgi:hypothetical protein
VKLELKASGNGVYFSVGYNNHHPFIDFIIIINPLSLKEKKREYVSFF